ncbi:MAG: MliC family protein [Hyphomonadaceae bacterium]
MRIVALGLALLAAGCAGGVLGPEPGPAPIPVPLTGQIAYACDNGAQLAVDYENNQARVAIVGGPSMVLPNVGSAEAPYYSNGRYGLRGGGATAQWEVGRSAPTNCRGS